MTAYVWAAGVVCGLVGGVALLPALGEATLAAAGGLAAWELYRQASGRADGLAIIMLACLGPSRHILDGPSTGLVGTACFLVVQLPMAPIAGLCLHGPREKSRPAGVENEVTRTRDA